MAADLPPSSSVHGLSFSAAILAISLPTALDSGERELVDLGVGGQRTTGLGPAGDDRQHTLGQPGLGEDLGHREQRQRGLRGGLQHDGAAGQQRGAELVGGQEERHVPRRDGGDDADRLAQHHRLAVDPVAEVAPGELVGGAGEVLERRHRGAVLHHVDDRRRLSGLGGQQELQLVGALLQDLDGAAEHRGALLRRHVRPRALVEGLAGGSAGGVDVGLGGQRHLADQFAGGRRVHLDDLGGRRLDPLAADEQLVPLGLERGALCHGVTLPTIEKNENLFHSRDRGGRSTSTRLLTRNSRSTGTLVSHHAHRGW